jgi:hypothetical protein
MSFEVADVEALVLGVRVRVRVLDPDEQGGDPAQLAGERLDEADRAAAPDGEGLAPVPRGQRAERRLEGRVRGVRHPRRAGGLHPDRDLDPPGRRAPERRREALRDVGRVHVRHEPDADPGPRRVDEDVARVPAARGLDRVHRQGGLPPVHLAGVELPEDLDAGQEPGLPADVRRRHRQRLQRAPRLGREGPDAVAQARDGDGAVIVDERGEHPRERHGGVRDRPAPDAGVEARPERADLDLQRHQAAERDGHGREAGIQVAGVGEHHGVGVEAPPVLTQELPQMLGADLLLALDHHAHVERELARAAHPAVHRRGVDEDARLVVGGPAAVEAPLAHGGLEGRRSPGALLTGRLDVVVRVEEQGRSPAVPDALAVDVGVRALDGEHLHVLEAPALEQRCDRLRAPPHLGRREPGERDARDADEPFEVVQIACRVRPVVVERLGDIECVRRHQVPARIAQRSAVRLHEIQRLTAGATARSRHGPDRPARGRAEDPGFTRSILRKGSEEGETRR